MATALLHFLIVVEEMWERDYSSIKNQDLTHKSDLSPKWVYYASVLKKSPNTLSRCHCMDPLFGFDLSSCGTDISCPCLLLR